MDKAFPLMNTTAKVPMFPIDVPVVVQSTTTWPQPRAGKIAWTTRFGVHCYTFAWSEDDGKTYDTCPIDAHFDKVVVTVDGHVWNPFVTRESKQ